MCPARVHRVAGPPSAEVAVTTLDGQRRHESPDLEAMVGRMLNALIRRCAEGDTEAVEALGNLEALARHAHTAGLAEARRAGGYSLAELAKVTGTTRQAVSQRTATGAAAACLHHGCVGMRRCRVPGATIIPATQSGVSAADVPPIHPDTEHMTERTQP